MSVVGSNFSKWKSSKKIEFLCKNRLFFPYLCELKWTKKWTELGKKYEPLSLTISEKNLLLNPGHNLKGTQSHKKYIIGGLQLEKLKFQCL